MACSTMMDSAVQPHCPFNAMQLSTSLSDAVLSLSACYAAYTLHSDVSAFPLGADPSAAEHALPSIVTSLLPPHLHLISLSTLLEWGFALIGAAAAAGHFPLHHSPPCMPLLFPLLTSQL